MLTFNKTGTEDLLTSKEAAALSGYKLDYIDHLCQDKKIDCQMIGGNWHISKQSLLNYKLQSEMRAAPDVPVVGPSGRAKIVPKHKPSEVKSGPRGGKKIIHMIKVPLVREHFSGKKLARLNQAIQEGSLKATNILQGSASNLPARDFWHKALSMMTAIILVFGSYYVIQSGIVSGQISRFSAMSKETSEAAASLEANDIKSTLAYMGVKLADDVNKVSEGISSIVYQTKEKIIVASLTVKFAKDELVSNPFLFIWQAGNSYKDGVVGFYSGIKKVAYGGAYTISAVALGALNR
jgi:hypothetical protein